MPVARYHPNDGHKRYDYEFRKVAHLKRSGLVSNSSTGFGQNGGAAPDWLIQAQKDEAKAVNKRRAQIIRRRFGDLLEAAE